MVFSATTPRLPLRSDGGKGSALRERQPLTLIVTLAPVRTTGDDAPGPDVLTEGIAPVSVAGPVQTLLLARMRRRGV